jgi:mercuric ion transport protein
MEKRSDKKNISVATTEAAFAASGKDKRASIAAAGGIIGAIAASSCCLLPLILFSLGVGGAWIGNFTALEPYRPFFITVTLGFLGYGHYLVYRQDKAACADGSCAKPLPQKAVKAALWAATLLIFAAILFPYVAPFLLDNH